MLENKESILFNKKSISSKFNEFERGYNEFIEKSINYKMPKKYDWDVIKDQYLEVFIVKTQIGTFKLMKIINISTWMIIWFCIII